LTHDFKNFIRISDIHPEKNYNWTSAELIRWEVDNGKICDGILYKPEDFDSTKKYPVVVSIYDEFSRGLNQYIQPGLHGFCNFLPTSWLTSNGYLVFLPDIVHRKQGAPLKDAYDMLISGVNTIAKLPFVDQSRIGIEGASWGGEQINYIITHTNIFAAAFMGAGYSERISGSGYSDNFVQVPRLIQNKTHFGGLLTEVPNTYIEEAPLFSANHLTTPLLIRHNKDDDAVPFYQGLQFFRTLRVLGKKVWMLQYDKGGHGVKPGKDSEDMYLRIAQFFDHYLKGAPPPKWMTEGILPERKQIDTGLELDLPGAIP
jgi:dipeptidyl aminopeptidase/acylaminoacyl peptidase